MLTNSINVIMIRVGAQCEPGWATHGETHSDRLLCGPNRLLNTFSIIPDDVFFLSEILRGWLCLLSLFCFLSLVLIFVLCSEMLSSHPSTKCHTLIIFKFPRILFVWPFIILFLFCGCHFFLNHSL